MQSIVCLVMSGCLACVCAAAAAQDFPRRATTPAIPKPATSPQQSGDQLVKVTATADVQQISPGQTFHLAFIFDIEPQWHIYWQNPGNAGGGPTSIKVNAPAHFAVGKIRFPRPMIIEAEDGTTYGYENKTALFVEVTAPPDLMLDQAMFSATVNWMVCKDVCLLGRSTHMVTLPVGDAPSGRPLSQSSSDPAVAEFKAQLPRPLSDLSGADASFDGTTLTIHMPDSGHNTAQFFPIELPGVEFGDATIKHDEAGDTINISVPVRANHRNAMGKSLAIKATVGMGTRQSDPYYEIEIALPEP